LYLLGSGLLLLQDALDVLLLFDHESADNSVTNTSTAQVTTVDTANVLLTLRDVGVLLGSQVGDLQEEREHKQRGKSVT
tara:strand:- start:279 stop:515 length:237 start_codon:yes stop_codon:yes gene_type:complete